jgi:hypothetical protein
MLRMCEVLIHRQADGFTVVLLGVGQGAKWVAHLGVVGLGVDGDVVHIHPNALGAQPFKDLAVCFLSLV